MDDDVDLICLKDAQSQLQCVAFRSTVARLRFRLTEGSEILLRGRAVPGVNKYQPRPKYIEGKCMPFRGFEEWK